MSAVFLIKMMSIETLHRDRDMSRSLKSSVIRELQALSNLHKYIAPIISIYRHASAPYPKDNMLKISDHFKCLKLSLCESQQYHRTGS